MTDFSEKKSNVQYIEDDIEIGILSRRLSIWSRMPQLTTTSIRSIILHLAVATTYLILITAWVKIAIPPRLPALIHIPARDALQYQVTEMYTREDDPNPYMGISDASDEAWHKLMERRSTTDKCKALLMPM
ncbi:hypothetical protein CGMCC3_g10850 [Colletotrichum fructicola]|uniref:Uncharacterized protein n=2 Tax=Colletotrichum gloeosporioides species complex TaxID=2707338 RepID=L2G7L6_COLFN|nr:uncharacterized protein CGMCC3_g10850 [Colletotrichum fructicola]KAE9573108.1 hypothetical protein CGMCC3_g10850 [Colletotrichum fructicola]KAF5495964.1 hypothetical protein CGCF413_v008184 [Colletotrichum fructicola]KAK1855908.1 hypothetical protein CCHR01_01458 [Colletotrichum chrysophilum]